MLWGMRRTSEWPDGTARRSGSTRKTTNLADLEKSSKDLVLKNAYLDAKIGVDTEKDGPSKIWVPKYGLGSWYM